MLWAILKVDTKVPLFFAIILSLDLYSCNVLKEVAKAIYIFEKVKIDKEVIYGTVNGTVSIEMEEVESSDIDLHRTPLEIYEFEMRLFSQTPTSVARFIISFELDIQEPEFFLPSIWIKDNKFSQDKVYSTLVSKRWIVREDRLPVPCVMARGKNGETFALLKLPATYDSSAGMDNNVREIIYEDGTDISGFGFDYESKKLILTFPFEEYPVVYRRKIMTQITMEGKKAFTVIERGKDKTIKFFVIVGKTDSFNSAVSEIWKIAYDKLIGQSTVVVNDDLKEKVKRALALYFKNYFYRNKISGFFPFVDTYTGNITFLKFLEAGFTGMVLMNARNSIELGRDLGDDELVRMGEEVINSWIDFGTKNGIFIDCWDISRDSICNLSPIFFSDSFFTRRAFESLLAIYMAFSAEEKRGIKKEKWKSAFVNGARKLMTFQNDDGSFARRYSFDGEVKDSSPVGTLFAVPVFVRALEVTGDRDFLYAAENAGRIIVRFADNFEYYGATIDANSEDKEAAMWTLYSCYLLFKMTGDEKYERCVDNSLYASLSWFFLWDVPFSSDQLFRKIGLKTRGLGAVSVENNHVDVYSFFFVKILKEIAKIQKSEDNRRRLENIADIIFNAILSVVPVENDRKGIVIGIVPEVIQQTWWDYGFYGKGSYAPLSATGWAVASVLSTIYPDGFFR